MRCCDWLWGSLKTRVLSSEARRICAPIWWPARAFWPGNAVTAPTARARAVLAALGPLDVGQAAVAAGGQIIGIETLQGTDAVLRFVADSAPGSGGVLVKRAKPGQDLRVDMPAIGPDTVALCAKAGLSGIELQAGHVLMLDPVAVVAACRTHAINLWAVP